MKKPKCRLCGHEHYSHEAHLFAPASAVVGAVRAAIGMPVRAPRPSVMKTPIHPPGRIAELESENKRLTDEVKRLKRALAGKIVNGVDNVNAPVTPVNKPPTARSDMAAYMRRRRAEARAKAKE